MSDGANTPPTADRDLSYLGPATLAALHIGVRACDDALHIYEGLSARGKLDASQRRDRDEWLEARHKLLTQPYPPPYVPGANTARHDSG